MQGFQQHFILGVGLQTGLPQLAGLVALPARPQHFAQMGGDFRVGTQFVGAIQIFLRFAPDCLRGIAPSQRYPECRHR